VADGYGNSRVVKFSREGKYLLAWGKRGTAPGDFNLPHSVAVDSKGRVYVSDRENNRIQIFDPNGKFLAQWTHLGATQNIFITPKDEVWIITHRDNVENITYDTLAGRIMRMISPPARSWARWKARVIGSTSRRPRRSSSAASRAMCFGGIRDGWKGIDDFVIW